MTATPTPTKTPVSAATRAGVTPAPAATDDRAASDQVEAAVDWQAFGPTDTADHLATMDKAARESGCGVPWQLLAAIARVESDFGRNMTTSWAGAIGYGQFLPSSWDVFGSEGNAYDYHDALPAIASYLCRGGLARDPRAALFAYNHADWYVDLVLDLAVRYDRLAPREPTPDVLDVGPTERAGLAMHYAAGRDVQLKVRPRVLEGDVRWLGMPWRGREPGKPISSEALEATTLSTLLGGFGLKDRAQPTGSDGLTSLASAAWEAGLLPIDEPEWTPGAIRQHILRSRPVVVMVDGKGLPGHPPEEQADDQPLVVIGATPDGLIYSDPSFSSSLGYGLEIKDIDLLKLWDEASQPRQARGFGARPRPLARQAHLSEAEPPPPLARVTSTPTPLPHLPRVELAAARHEMRVLASTAVRQVAEEPVQVERDPGGDYSWLVLFGAGLFVAGVFAVKRLRPRTASAAGEQPAPDR